MSRTVAGPGASHDYAGIAANENVKTFRDLPVKSYAEAKAMHEALMSLLNRTGGRSWIRFGHVSGGKICMTHNARGNVFISEFIDREESDPPQLGDHMVGYEVILYNTPIVRYYPDDMFSVDNGGFNTPMTTTRINQFTPSWFRVYHDNKKLVGKGRICDHDFRWHVEKGVNE